MPNAPVVNSPRLPMPSSFADLRRWNLLVTAIFPKARSVDSVLLALDYCAARNLDVMKRPVNIVPMYDSDRKAWIETIWPSIVEIEITAARTGLWAGIDQPVYGPLKTETFKSDRGDAVTVTFPESCSVVAYKMVGGQRCAFCGEVCFWIEECARTSDGIPNSMWRKRPRRQLAKVAKAAALRAAFPEENPGPVAEEMEGQTLNPAELAAADSDRPDNPALAPQSWTAPEKTEPPHDPETGEVGPHLMPRQFLNGNGEDWRVWGARFLAGIDAEDTIERVKQYYQLNQEIIDVDMREEAPKIHERLVARINKRINDLTIAASSDAEV